MKGCAVLKKIQRILLGMLSVFCLLAVISVFASQEQACAIAKVFAPAPYVLLYGVSVAGIFGLLLLCSVPKRNVGNYLWVLLIPAVALGVAAIIWHHKGPSGIEDLVLHAGEGMLVIPALVTTLWCLVMAVRPPIIHAPRKKIVERTSADQKLPLRATCEQPVKNVVYLSKVREARGN